MNTNLFGTDGIRNRIGREPFTLIGLAKLGNALGLWAQQKYNAEHVKNFLPITPKITALIATDTRNSAALVKTGIATGILANDIHLVDVGILPTPALYALLQNQSKFRFGIMISASHNPYDDNGIKIIDAQTGKLTPEDELSISFSFYQAELPSLHPDQLGTLKKWTRPATRIYLNYMQDQKKNRPSVLSLSPLRKMVIVLDCAHGATSKVAREIFKHIPGRLIIINNRPDGFNINKKCGALDLKKLQAAVLKHKATFGFAFDGDGDRIIAVNRHGEIKDGDDIIALLTQHPRYKNQKTIVGTIMTNAGLASYLEKQNKNLMRTPVGDKHVASYLKTHDLLLGGEQSGHIIMRDYLNCGDGMYTALSILEAVIHTNNYDLDTFTRYPQVLINVPIMTKKDLTAEPYAAIISHYAKQLTYGRLEVRYSGTENLLRVMVESKDAIDATTIGNALVQELKNKQLHV